MKRAIHLFVSLGLMQVLMLPCLFGQVITNQSDVNWGDLKNQLFKHINVSSQLTSILNEIHGLDKEQIVKLNSTATLLSDLLNEGFVDSSTVIKIHSANSTLSKLEEEILSKLKAIDFRPTESFLYLLSDLTTVKNSIYLKATQYFQDSLLTWGTPSKYIAAILSSDSIVIVSHKLTYGPKIINEKTGRSSKQEFLVVNGKPNHRIIRQIARLSPSGIDSLLNILIQATDSIQSSYGCFMPHHGILIFKNSHVSFIDICFHCRNFATSKDIENDIYLNTKGWEALELFFKKYKLTYEMPEVGFKRN